MLYHLCGLAQACSNHPSFLVVWGDGFMCFMAACDAINICMRINVSISPCQYYLSDDPVPTLSFQHRHAENENERQNHFMFCMSLHLCTCTCTCMYHIIDNRGLRVFNYMHTSHCSSTGRPMWVLCSNWLIVTSFFLTMSLSLFVHHHT